MTDVRIDDRVDGYLARPAAGDGPWPGVVVIQEIFGVDDSLRAQVDRFAEHGYLALAPDLYSWGNTVRCLLSTMRDLFTGGGGTLELIEAARRWLAGQPGCGPRVGVVGFCMGGGFALLAAPRYDFAAAAVNYGDLPRRPARALRGTCPVVASYGARDLRLRGAAGRLHTALEEVGAEHDVREYPGAGHGFMTEHDRYARLLVTAMGGGFQAEAAADAWQRMFDFLDRHLRADPRA